MSFCAISKPINLTNQSPYMLRSKSKKTIVIIKIGLKNLLSILNTTDSETVIIGIAMKL